MLMALSHHGPDGNSIWQHRGVYFGHQLMRVSAQSVHERCSWFHTLNQLSITADASLYNRQDLFQRLRIAQPEWHLWSDGQLILAAYEKWGCACPKYLLGDFAFAIWDDRQQQLFCCRDHLGRRPLYYYYDGKRYLFASEIKGILAASGINKELNRRHLAALANPFALHQDKVTTLFTGIKSVPPANILIVSEKGIRTQSYWQPDLSLRLGYQRDEEVLEAFQALMFEVVGARLQSAFPVAALLSGGLDSSAIVSVASRCLADQGKNLITLSAIRAGQSDEHIIDEREYIDQFKAYPNIELNYIRARDRGPLDDVENLIQNSESPLITSRHYLYSAFSEAAHSRGARIILDGAFGEIGPSFYGDDYFPELMLTGHWRTLRQEINSRSQLSNQSVWRIWCSKILRPLIKPHKTNFSNSRLQIFQSMFLNNHLADNLSTKPTTRRSKLTHRSTQYHSIVSAQKASRVVGFIGYQRVQMSYPFLDKRLLEFCLAAPPRLKVRNGYPRYLLRAGLEGILPSRIQWRTSKEPFSPDYHQRYNRQKTQARTFFENIKPNDPVQEVINVDHLKTLLAHDMTANRGNTKGNAAGLHIVPQAINFIAFLRQFPEFKQ